MPPYRLAAFDFDGTLADTMPWFLAMLNELAVRHRFRQVSGEEVEVLRHLGSREIMRSLGIRRWRVPFIARDLGRRSAEAAATGRFALFPGVAGLLDALSAAGVTVAVVSSNREATIRQVLGASAAQVSHFACSASLFGKARHFRRLVRLTRLPPQAMVSVGDEVRDIEAARAVGLATAAVTWGCAKESALRQAGPDAVFHTVADLRKALVGG